jgi:hypothetical protein
MPSASRSTIRLLNTKRWGVVPARIHCERQRRSSAATRVGLPRPGIGQAISVDRSATAADGDAAAVKKAFASKRFICFLVLDAVNHRRR